VAKPQLEDDGPIDLSDPSRVYFAYVCEKDEDLALEHGRAQQQAATSKRGE
jgi:hypothetical protein